MNTQISIRIAALASIVFAATCLWFAVDAFTSLADITNPEELSGAKSFVWFWTFLAAVGVAIAWVSWKVARAQSEDENA